MVNIDVDKIIGKEESYYSFVLAVAKRAREVADEQLKKTKDYIETEKSKSNSIDKLRQIPPQYLVKPVRVAIEEFNSGDCKMIHLEE